MKVEKWISDHTGSKGRTKKQEEEAEAKPKDPRGSKPTRTPDAVLQGSIARAPWNGKHKIIKTITKASAPSKPVVPDDNESNSTSSQSTSPKRLTSEDKNAAKYENIKTDKDDNGDTVVHITIKSSEKDKKK